ncbi:MAG: serine hydrolase [Acidobacteria bacterium]|nr:serine hydrolase [Acidobacteriota bacterium]
MGDVRWTASSGRSARRETGAISVSCHPPTGAAGPHRRNSTPGAGASRGAKCTTRTPGRSAESPGTPASSAAFARSARSPATSCGEGTPTTRWSHRRPSSARVPGSSRALGWDTMLPTSSCGTRMSPEAVGHTGFTGTSLWLDPRAGTYVALLTNRVHPTRANDRILAVRPAFHDAVRSRADRRTAGIDSHPARISAPVRAARRAGSPIRVGSSPRPRADRRGPSHRNAASGRRRPRRWLRSRT